MPKLVVKLTFKGRSLRSETKTDKCNEEKVTSTERVRKHREKLKNEPSLKEKLEENKAKKIIDNIVYRQQVKELRKQNPKYDEEIKAKERLRKQKQRKRKAEQKAKDISTSDTASNTRKKTQTIVQKAANKRKRAERARKGLPKESELWAETVSHIIQNATPKRKSMLKVDSESSTNDGIDTVIGLNKVGRPKKIHENVKKQLAFSGMSSIWKSNKSHGQYKARQKRQVKRLSKTAQYKNSWKGEIEEFLSDNSRVMPNKKDTININGTPVAKRHLLCSKLELYMKFKKLHPNFNRKFVTFFKMIPRNYKKLDLTCRRVCVCTKDYNLDQKVEALNKIAKIKSMPEMHSTTRQLSNITVCPFHDQPNRACVDRKCNSCGTMLIKTMYTPLLEICSDKDKMRYHQWEVVPESYTDKNGKRQTTTRWMQAEKHDTAIDLVDDIINNMELFTGHQFRSDYQHKVEKQLMADMPLDHLVAVMDFSENISLQQQDEIESAHWTTKQVTLHPIHIVRHAADSTSEQPNLLKESLIVLSESLAHNSNAVFVFTNQLMLHIRDNPGPCDIKVVHRFSDNCATQYKCKDAFAHIAMIEESHNIRLVYHYTESGHGKGPSDGLGAAIKARLQRLILGGKVINNAYEAYLALVQSQGQTLNQRVIYIPQRKLNKEIPQKTEGLKTVKGTHSFHMIKTKNGEANVLECSDLSCSCMVCLDDQEGPCYLSKYRHASETHYLLNTKLAKNGPQRTNAITNQGEGVVSVSDIEQSKQLSVEDNNNHIAQHIANMLIYSNSVAKKGWQIRGQTPADGNCCFWAISDQLDRAGIQNTSHVQLRQNVVKYIKDLSESAMAEMEKFMTTSLDTYVQTMSTDGNYADHICLQAVSKMLYAEIHIVHADLDNVVLSPTVPSTCTLVIGYLPESLHYVSLEPFKRFEVNDFVAVVLSKKRKSQLYIAKVLQEYDNDVQLRFLKSCRVEGLFTWPDIEDVSCQPQVDIIQKLTPPQLMPGRGLKLKFDSQEINLCKKNI